MLILGIETSGPRGGIALCRDGVCLAEENLEEVPRRHAQTLVSQIAETLKRLNLGAADLDGVAVSIGPGSFTGLRVGVVCAKTLAYATGCKLAAVDTLEATAANSPGAVDVVHVIVDAQRGDVFLATYRRSAGNEWTRERPVAVVAARTWIEGLSAGDAVTGPGLSVYGDRVPPQCQKLSESAWIPSARNIAQIGARQIARGELADCATLEPLYIRRSSAEERADRSTATGE